MLRAYARVVLPLLAWLSAVDPVLGQQVIPGQPDVSLGIVAPITWNQTVEIVRGDVTGALGLWGEISFRMSEAATLHFSVELPRSAAVEVRHVGSAGYIATYDHREIPIVVLGGFRIREVEGFQMALLVGGGVALWRTTTTFERTGFLEPAVPEISTNNTVAAAFIGGVELQATLSERLSAVGRFLVRYTGGAGSRSGSNPFVGYFGPLTLSPGLGLRIAL
jgi:hypothetical protein